LPAPCSGQLRPAYKQRQDSAGKPFDRNADARKSPALGKLFGDQDSQRPLSVGSACQKQKRRPWYLYVDEFQNFMNLSVGFERILAEQENTA